MRTSTEEAGQGGADRDKETEKVWAGAGGCRSECEGDGGREKTRERKKVRE